MQLLGYGPHYKAFCFEEVARAMEDPAVCDLIDPNNTRRDGCYWWFGLCEKMKNSNARDICYTEKAESDIAT